MCVSLTHASPRPAHCPLLPTAHCCVPWLQFKWNKGVKRDVRSRTNEYQRRLGERASAACLQLQSKAVRLAGLC